ncbi:MAG: hypothetical protein JW938_07195 [Candidatus Omnitrophica bacterium]|nr:hypothetical protein [Candidatus Omnitrophota bacterium]
MTSYHDPLDIMPFPRETTSSHERCHADQKKKESFIDYLLSQYAHEQKDTQVNSADSQIYGKIKRDLERLEHSVLSLEKKIVAAQSTEHIENIDVSLMQKRFDELYNALDEKVMTYIAKVEQLAQREPAQNVSNIDGEKQRLLVKRVELLKYYEFENVKLKQMNMKLMRLQYEKKIIERAASSTTDNAAHAGRVPEPSGNIDIQYLMEEIKNLEAKKTALIKDNIQLNEFSHEIIDENNRLKEELAKLEGQRKAVS